jgi:restriction system protein
VKETWDAKEAVMAVPKLADLYNPVVQALRQLGGSASKAELNNQVIKLLSLSDDDLAETTGSGTPKIVNQLAWARIDLRRHGIISDSENGVWVLTPKGQSIDVIDPSEIRRRTQRRDAGKQETQEEAIVFTKEETPEITEAQLEQSWKEQLLTTLRNLHPGAFERLCQRILRESDFSEVRVTGQTGDGGIDGVGIVQFGGLLSFPVVFQCKRYQGSVSAGEIRNFRGAMTGRADRGLFITTGTFTQSARQEATRDGAPLISLVDGEQLVEKLKELRLGVTVKMIEEVTVLPEWFKEI